MQFIGQILLLALNIYMWIVILDVAISWLIAFEVINPTSPQSQNLLNLLKKATDPAYKPLRRFVPDIGGIDITPVIIVFAIYILKMIVVQLFFLGGPYSPYWM